MKEWTSQSTLTLINYFYIRIPLSKRKCKFFPKKNQFAFLLKENHTYNGSLLFEISYSVTVREFPLLSFAYPLFHIRYHAIQVLYGSLILLLELLCLMSCLTHRSTQNHPFLHIYCQSLS